MGILKEGKGNLTTQSEVLHQSNYSFRTHFIGDEKGTYSEELLTAAHAACFTMAVSYALNEKGLEAKSLDREAVVKMDNNRITRIYLSITGEVGEISIEDFEVITKEAEKNCLISKVLNVPIAFEAILIV